MGSDVPGTVARPAVALTRWARAVGIALVLVMLVSGCRRSHAEVRRLLS